MNILVLQNVSDPWSVGAQLSLVVLALLWAIVAGAILSQKNINFLYAYCFHSEQKLGGVAAIVST